jgi:hypothetical protein
MDNKNGGNDRKQVARDEGDDQDSSPQNGNGKHRNKWQNNKKNGKKQRNGNGGNKKDKGGCPFHGSQHPWDKCFGNPDSPNYKPDYELPMPNGLHFHDKKVRFNGGGCVLWEMRMRLIILCATTMRLKIITISRSLVTPNDSKSRLPLVKAMGARRLDELMCGCMDADG